jgi:PIN domain nuclease of toxin-antitoxin system
LKEPLDVWMPDRLKHDGFVMLNVTVEHAVAVAALPDHHHDPFDRLLVAQALLEGLTIVTSDTAFDDYEVRVLDART